ncbi:MAG: glycosyltransferase family 4 protein [Candidatus Komeilibacteria bacterium]|nr:glycosyltransferase family 4 protein [Candidatus Komeilibacteria bacterium]
MKIAFIGQKGMPALYGGVEKYVEQVSQQLVALGNEVYVYARPYYTSKKIAKYRGVHIINLPSIHTKNLDAISHTFLATMHAIFSGYDVIHYQGVGPSLLAWIPRILNPSIKVVTTFHSLDRKHAKWSGIAKIALTMGEWSACKFSHQVITVSRGLQKYCLERYNTPTTYIPNGVQITRRFTVAKTLKTYNLKERRYFIVAARFVSHKRIHDVISAFQNLKNKNLRLVVVGGSTFTAGYAARLRELAAKDKRVVFTGFIDSGVIYDLMSKSLAYISASEDEGLPITLLEALAAGAPVIVSNIDGHLEIVEQCHGTVFEVGNISELTACMRKGLHRQAEALKYARINKRVMASNYNWVDIAKALTVAYTDIQLAPQSITQSMF